MVLSFILAFVATLALLGAVAAAITASPHLGRPGRAMSRWMSAAPGLDVAVSALTWAPWVAAAACGGWSALVGTVAAQVVLLYAWAWAHDALNPIAAGGPRIMKFLAAHVGPRRNHAALWVTAVTVPVFWLIRAAEVLVYPLLVWLVRLPSYNQGEWVNVSRHKFEGLVGHDLIWCLYCDWMTGVYSLGAEMLRNVESFWCPIRFHNAAKCANCRIDFPDLDAGWIRPDGDMTDVENLMTDKFAGGNHAWFGHPARLTVGGRDPHGQRRAHEGGQPAERDR